MPRDQEKGFALWFTGLPASGKSSVAKRTAQVLSHDLPVHVLDSDDLRSILTPAPTYDEPERQWFYGVMVFLAQLLVNHGVNVLIAATAHKQEYRDRARASISRFAEIYVQCAPATCRHRDPKGLYAKAEQGQIDRFPGVQLPYEPPDRPDLVLDTERHDLATCVAQVLSFLRNGNIHAKNLPKGSIA